MPSRNSSSASRCAFVSFAGTATRSRASRSPRPSPFSFGAPRPLTRRSFPSCGAGRDLQRHAAVGRRDLDRRAERRLVERDRHLEHEVVAAPLVQLRRLDPRHDEEVAGGRAAPAGLALALELDLRAVLDARGDPHRVALRPPLAAGAVAGRARRLDDRAVAAAASGTAAGARRGPARSRRRRVPSHCGQRFGAVPGAAPVPWQVWQASSSVTGTVVCRPFSESSNEMRTSTSTSTPRWPRCACAAPAAAAAAEEPAEDVAEIEVAEVDVRRAPAGRWSSRTGRTACASRGRRARRRRAWTSLKRASAAVVARVLVRVVLAGELAVRLLQLVRRGVLRDAERLVEGARPPRSYSCLAAVRRRAAPELTTTRAGRSTWSPSR